MVYPYYFDTISIVWKYYTIIMDNQISIIFPIKVHTISILWIFKICSSGPVVFLQTANKRLHDVMHRIINVGQNYTPNNYIPQARLVSNQHLVSIIL